MLHILGFTLLFPATCLLLVATAGRFRMIFDVDVLLLGIVIVYALTTVPGAITAVVDHLLLRRGVPYRSLYCALVAAIVTPVVALSIYPGASSAFWMNALICSLVGAASGAVCSLIVRAVRHRLHANA